MKLHPRHEIMRKASIALDKAIDDFEFAQGELSSAEWLAILQRIQSDIITSLIKEQDREDQS